jgi:hypothetical protein
VTPSEFEELLDRVPFRPMVIVLASGDRVIIRNRDSASVEDLSVTIRMGRGRISDGVRVVSIPNISFLEQHGIPLPPGGRRRR